VAVQILELARHSVALEVRRARAVHHPQDAEPSRPEL